jgi:hypothetical protein
MEPLTPVLVYGDYDPSNGLIWQQKYFIQ